MALSDYAKQGEYARKVLSRIDKEGAEAVLGESMRDMAITEFLKIYTDKVRKRELGDISKKNKDDISKELKKKKYKRLLNVDKTKIRKGEYKGELKDEVDYIKKVTRRYRASFDSRQQEVGDIEARDDILQQLKIIYGSEALASRNILTDLILREGGWKDPNYNARARKAVMRGLYKIHRNEEINDAKIKLLSYMYKNDGIPLPMSLIYLKRAGKNSDIYKWVMTKWRHNKDWISGVGIASTAMLGVAAAMYGYSRTGERIPERPIQPADIKRLNYAKLKKLDTIPPEMQAKINKNQKYYDKQLEKYNAYKKKKWNEIHNLDEEGKSIFELPALSGEESSSGYPAAIVLDSISENEIQNENKVNTQLKETIIENSDEVHTLYVDTVDKMSSNTASPDELKKDWKNLDTRIKSRDAKLEASLKDIKEELDTDLVVDTQDDIRKTLEKIKPVKTKEEKRQERLEAQNEKRRMRQEEKDRKKKEKEEERLAKQKKQEEFKLQSKAKAAERKKKFQEKLALKKLKAQEEKADKEKAKEHAKEAKERKEWEDKRKKGADQRERLEKEKKLQREEDVTMTPAKQPKKTETEKKPVQKMEITPTEKPVEKKKKPVEVPLGKEGAFKESTKKQAQHDPFRGKDDFKKQKMTVDQSEEIKEKFKEEVFKRAAKLEEKSKKLADEYIRKLPKDLLEDINAPSKKRAKLRVEEQSDIDIFPESKVGRSRAVVPIGPTTGKRRLAIVKGLAKRTDIPTRATKRELSIQQHVLNRRVKTLQAKAPAKIKRPAKLAGKPKISHKAALQLSKEWQKRPTRRPTQSLHQRLLTTEAPKSNIPTTIPVTSEGRLDMKRYLEMDFKNDDYNKKKQKQLEKLKAKPIQEKVPTALIQLRKDTAKAPEIQGEPKKVVPAKKVVPTKTVEAKPVEKKEKSSAGIGLTRFVEEKQDKRDKSPTRSGRDSPKRERDYKKEYARDASSDEAIKKRSALNKYNKEQGTYGNGDKLDASHDSSGKIAGFEDQSKNRARKRGKNEVGLKLITSLTKQIKKQKKKSKQKKQKKIAQNKKKQKKPVAKKKYKRRATGKAKNKTAKKKKIKKKTTAKKKESESEVRG